jgi:hypothetical protein
MHCIKPSENLQNITEKEIKKQKQYVALHVIEILLGQNNLNYDFLLQ